MESVRPWKVTLVLLVMVALALGVPFALGASPSERFCLIRDTITPT